MNDEPTPPTTPPDAAPKASRPKRPKPARGSARAATAPTADPDARTRPDFAARFRSAGTTPGHTCPKGHGATEPVEPGHTYCATCGRHYTVRAEGA